MEANSSPLAATVMTLKVFRRLLNDESVLFTQFSYLVENIHNPLLDACTSNANVIQPDAPKAAVDSNDKTASTSDGRKKSDDAVFPKVSPSTTAVGREIANAVVSNNSIVSDLEQSQRGKLLSDEDTNNNSTDKPSNSLSAPEPALKTALANKTKNNAPGGKVAADKKNRKVMNYSQYWGLFANTSTLYTAHAALLQQLDSCVTRLTALLDRLQREDEESYSGTSNHASWFASRSQRNTGKEMGSTPEGELPSPAPIPPRPGKTTFSLSAPLSTEKDGVMLGSGSTANSSGTKDCFQELSAIVLDFFASPDMNHYMLEYMMYVVNYTRSGAQRVLELSRLWRWSMGETGGSSGSLAALSHLQPAERATLLSYAPMLDFLHRSFGDKGFPDDPRVKFVSLPEREKMHVTGEVSDPSAAIASRRQQGGGANTSGGAVTAANKGKVELPRMPGNWSGFNTLLTLLSTPFSSLRRYIHVASCLLNSCALPVSDREQLFCGFLALAVQRQEEVTSLVMDELTHRDAESIIGLMEEVTGVSTGHSSPEEGEALWRKFRYGRSDSRVLIHYGRIMKKYRRNNKHERLLFLFDDALCYVDELTTGRLRPRGFMPLSIVRIQSVTCVEESQTCFQIVTPQKVFTFYTDTEEQKRQWIDATRFAIKHVEREKNKQQGRTVNGQSDQLASRHVFSRTFSPKQQRDMETVREYQKGNKQGEDVESVMRELERKMKSFVPTLPRKCRLARQKRFDVSWQNSLDKQRLLAAESSFTIQTSAEACKTLNVNSNVNYNNSMALEHISSANASFANLSLARSTSRQLEYDITPWARQSSTYRKGMSTSQEFVNSPSALPPTAPTSGHMDQAQKKLALQVSEELPPLPDNISVSSRQSRGGATPLRRPVYERFDSARPSPQHSCVNRAENSVGSHGRASGSLPSSALATPKEADYDEDIELDSSGSSVSDTEAGPYVDETKEEIPETETADNGNYNLFSEKSVDEQNEIAVKSFLEPRLMSNSIIASSNGDEEPGSPPLPAGGGVDLQHIVSFDGEAAFGEDKDKELVNKDGELSSLGGDESDEASEAPEEQEEGEEGKDVAETS